MTPNLDISVNRAVAKYTRWQQLMRVLWAVTTPLFRLSPRPLFGWRRVLLRCFGARVGRNVNIYPSAAIVMPWNFSIGDFSAIGEDALIYCLGPITIGSRVTVSQRAHLCAGSHDFTDPTMPLLKPPITIGDQAWICADAFVGPGVVVGAGAVVGARAVVVRDVLEWSVVVGNPARTIRSRVLRGTTDDVHG